LEYGRLAVADEADIAGDYVERLLQHGIAKESKQIPAGVAGICVLCDEDSLRLINGKCARCRDVEAQQLKLRGRL
jgi:hypothetical protein